MTEKDEIKQSFWKKLFKREHERSEIADRLEQRYRAQGEYDPDLDKRHKGTKSLLVAIPMSIFAAIWFVVQHVANLIFAVFYLIYALFFSSISYAIGTVVVIMVVLGGWYFITGSTASLPSSIFDIAAPATTGSLEDIFAQDDMKAYYIPKELKPIMPITQNSIVLERYKYLITSGEVGPHAEGAINILKNTLGNKNPDLRSAAYEALLLIGTREAKLATEKVRSLGH